MNPATGFSPQARSNQPGEGPRELPSRARAKPVEGTGDFRRKLELRIESLREKLALLPLRGRQSADLEIGCGHGHFLCSWAKAFPERLCLGVDLQKGRLDKALRKAAADGLSNIHFIKAEAGEFLSALPGNVFFDRIFLLFPDPWHKRRHHKNRLLRPSFLSSLAKCSTRRAELFFRTDHQGYHEEAAGILAHHPDWRVTGEGDWPMEVCTVFQAKARRYYSLRAVRKDPSR